MRRLALAPLAALILLLPLGAQSPGTAATAYPSLSVRKVVTGLQTPWDVQELPNGDLLYDEREAGTLSLWDGTDKHTLATPADGWSNGETGIMGLALDRDFAENKRFYVCRGVTGGGTPEINVEAWTLDLDEVRATKADTLLTGIRTVTGRHGGCRLLMGSGGYLYVGTGDAAIWSTPQQKYSLNGKVLRLDPATGAPAAGNPWVTSTNLDKRYVYNYGHRNVQGLAQRADGRVWSVEHGSYRDDEVNALYPRANYGWSPKGPGYDESPPMTSYKLPGKQVGAKWSSGSSTIATSGASWVQGSRWGAYDGMLAVGVLKGERLQFLRFSAGGTFQASHVAPALNGDYGRLRSVTRAANGDLLVTTSNGSGDAILRVSPR